MTILLAIWRFLGLKGTALIAVIAALGVMSGLWYFRGVELTAAHAELTAQKDQYTQAVNTRDAAITALKDANDRALDLLAQFKADLAENQRQVAHVQAENKALTAQEAARLASIGKALHTQGCDATNVSGTIRAVICEGGSCATQP